jgi:hypothetical protein
MSIVIAVADMTRVVVKSDEIIRDKDTNKSKLDKQENIRSLNKNCIVGFTGNQQICELVLTEYKRLAEDSLIDIDTLKPTTVIFDLCELVKAIHDNSSEITFLIAGKENSRVVLFTFSSSENYEINNFTPLDNTHIKYIAIGSEYCKTHPYSKFYNTDKPFEATMNGYIRFISSVDPNVNTYITTRKIKVFN